MNKVYVVQQAMRRVSYRDVQRWPDRYTEAMIGEFVPAFDLSPAAKFGEIELLLDSQVHIGIAVQPLKQKFRDKLQHITADDYFLPVGDPIAMCLAMHIALEYSGGSLNALRWDNRQKEYIKVRI